MKKRMHAVLAGLLVVILAGCGDLRTEDRAAGAPVGVSEVLSAGMEAEDAKLAEAEPEDEGPEEAEPVEAAGSETKETEETEPEEAESEGAEPGSEGPEEAPEEAEPEAAEPEEEVDVDLTVLSSTMVYSEVYNMMVTPEDYLGKIVKMEGMAASFYDEVTGNTYYACIISDATACCSQGIEFVLAEGYDYPEDGEDVCVSGVFDLYTEGEYTYCTLRGARRYQLPVER
ncbi:MAG: hypothetical protein K6E92_03035 [Lachnospiraceae bacterium]|nr:hypothetical protein [Lachnospiraceae bacterium]